MAIKYATVNQVHAASMNYGSDTLMRRTAAISFLTFPVMLFIGFILHPNFTSFAIVTTADQLVENFRHQPGFHYGHLIVMAAVPPIILSMAFAQRLLAPTKARLWGYWGAIIGIFGAAVLAVDKGALTLILSAFDTMTDAQIEQTKPALQSMIDRKGLLKIVILLPTLLLGSALQAIGLWKVKLLSLWQMASIVFGLALINNPDIEVISATGAIFMCLGYIPFALRLFRAKE